MYSMHNEVLVVLAIGYEHSLCDDARQYQQISLMQCV
jgi:hypothetical protein